MQLPKLLKYVVASRPLLRPLASAQLANTQSRPFGVALLIAGFDEKGPQLYHTDPSGTFVRYDAKAIGSGSDAAQQALQDAFHKAITLDEAKTLALKVLKQVMEEKLDENNVQLAQVCLASDSLRRKDNLPATELTIRSQRKRDSKSSTKSTSRLSLTRWQLRFDRR